MCHESNESNYFFSPKMKHSFREIDRVMCLVYTTDSFSKARRQAGKEGIKVSYATVLDWVNKYNLDFISGTGPWAKNNKALDIGLLNIYLNNEYKCIIKSGDCIPPELFENKPCTIKVEAVK